MSKYHTIVRYLEVKNELELLKKDLEREGLLEVVKLLDHKLGDKEIRSPDVDVKTFDTNEEIRLTKTGRAAPGEPVRVLRVWLGQYKKGATVHNSTFHAKYVGKMSPTSVSSAFHKLAKEGLLRKIVNGQWEVL